MILLVKQAGEKNEENNKKCLSVPSSVLSHCTHLLLSSPFTYGWMYKKVLNGETQKTTCTFPIIETQEMVIMLVRCNKKKNHFIFIIQRIPLFGNMHWRMSSQMIFLPIIGTHGPIVIIIMMTMMIIMMMQTYRRRQSWGQAVVQQTILLCLPTICRSIDVYIEYTQLTLIIMYCYKQYQMLECMYILNGEQDKENGKKRKKCAQLVYFPCRRFLSFLRTDTTRSTEEWSGFS